MIIGGGYIGGAASLAPPSAPTGVTAAEVFPDVGVSWSAGVGGGAVDQYRVEVSLNLGAFAFLANTVSTSYSDSTGYTSGDTVQYRVRAENTAGNSAFANSNTVTIS